MHLFFKIVKSYKDFTYTLYSGSSVINILHDFELKDLNIYKMRGAILTRG